MWSDQSAEMVRDREMSVMVSALTRVVSGEAVQWPESENTSSSFMMGGGGGSVSTVSNDIRYLPQSGSSSSLGGLVS